MTATMTPYRPPQQAGRDGFAQLLRAEWTKLRTLRGWVIALVIAAVLIGVVGALLPRGSGCPGGGTACLSHIPTGPGGEAVNDGYYLAGQPLAGDGSITVRVTSLTGMISNQGGYFGPNGPNETARRGLVPWAKAGIIITASTRPGAAYAAMMVTGSHGVRMQYDYTSDIAGLPGPVSAASPRWLRLTRSGDVVTGYDSADGRRWTKLGAASLAGLTGTVRAGPFATSPLDFTPNFPTYGEPGGGLSASAATGTFDHVDLRGGAPAGRWAGQSVGSGSSVGSSGLPRTGFHQAGGRLIVTGSGDIGPIVAAGVNSLYDTGTLEDHLFGVFIGLLIMIVIAAMFITVEYRRGLIATSLAASPRRGRLLAAKAVVIGLVTLVLGSAGVAVAVIAGAHIARSSGVYLLATGWLADTRIILGTGAMLAVASVLALAIGTMLRRSVATVATVVVAIVLPYILGVTGTLPAAVSEWILRVTPAAGYAIVQTVPQYPQVVGHYGPPDYYPLGPWSGLAVLCGYAVLALSLAAWLLRRRDAGGTA